MTRRRTSARSDRELRERLAHGEAAALGELYDRFAPLVHGLALRALDDEPAADTVTLDVLADAWRDPEAYDPEQGPLHAWLATLTHRAVLRRLGATGAEATEEVRRAAVVARADTVARSLPDAQRAALEQAYLRRRDYRQTAADLGISREEARRLLLGGLRKLAAAEEAEPPGTFPEEDRA
ncbi:MULTISPECIES: sigma factor [unclassified Streptomyces]|uniref:sigma factor n=1 Tax=unclassified Streptomyces TaxID=2593676 RepID=UPI001908B11F|nr:sigma factor [Streptomyces sp. HSG2]